MNRIDIDVVALRSAAVSWVNFNQTCEVNISTMKSWRIEVNYQDSKPRLVGNELDGIVDHHVAEQAYRGEAQGMNAVHQGIDEYSGGLTHIFCSDNNLAVTAFDGIIASCKEFMVPPKVRTDHGGEHVLIALLMRLYRGEDFISQGRLYTINVSRDCGAMCTSS